MSSFILTSDLKLGYIELALPGVRHSAIVNPVGQLKTIAEWIASA